MGRYESIYLVDDFEMVNILHGILLQKLGIENNIHSFTDPEKALGDLLSNKDRLGPTLLLLDINMPEMSGFQFLESMVKYGFPKNIDVVIVTSSISEKDRAMTANYTQYIRDFISKPLKIEQLKALLDNNKDIKNESA